MAVVSRLIEAAPAEVFDVLADGWLYPLWVVGATHMREVEEDWPAVGSRLHHSVGTWPVMLDDHTEVLDVEWGRRIVLRARAWPSGEARVEIELSPSPEGTTVTMTEYADSGPGAIVPAPVQDIALYPRNVESLARLSAVVTGRARPRPTDLADSSRRGTTSCEPGRDG
ncbi:SRPBCC domain-containing protein [Pseudonocardia sp. KRD291]|uniref:SRPBCC family protein n=1 Tax=Pseudonocardia sp. KRD291 TaxID=2792007 RepID=UPI001C49E201|nr:SRPBCC family protein [Pseudonocardia sp. KRD291]MBW0103964.1 SRPBCC family protein [Pseudonocardia sp. KRD291]